MSTPRAQRRAHQRLLRGVIAATLAGCACTPGNAQSPARITTAIEWAGRGTWIKADFHTHSKFTDGAHTVEEIVSAAAKNGCGAVAIADHGDDDLKGGTPEYLEAVRASRTAHPEITVLAAMEWNVPPGKGQEHAVVLFPAAMESAGTMLGFSKSFDDQNREKEGNNPELALKGFAALAPKDRAAVAPVVLFNHPSRRPKSPSLPALTIANLKKAAPSILVGFEGAPGHQRGVPLGAYQDPSMLVDRWDPLVATPNGGWDQWLRQGLDLWAAVANSDFHGEGDDFWPCEFAATWVYAPDRTVNGIIRAVRAGSFFAEHGHIVSEVELQARLGEQPRAVGAGETVAVGSGARATVTLRMTVPPADYLGRANRIDLVELFGVSKTSTDTLFSGPPATPTAFSVVVPVPPGGITLRARGRRNLEGGSALMFYTNPIRITAP